MAEAARSFVPRSRVERPGESVPGSNAQFPHGSDRRLPTVLFAALVVFLPGADAFGQAVADAARQQIRMLLEEKESRNAAQRKIDSRLLYAMRQGKGLDAAPGVPSLQTGIAVDAAQTTEVHITADVTAPLLESLRTLGARILDAYPFARSIRARVPISALETIAADPAVYFVGPKHQFLLEDERPGPPREFVYARGRARSSRAGRGKRRRAPIRARRARARASRRGSRRGRSTPTSSTFRRGT